VTQSLPPQGPTLYVPKPPGQKFTVPKFSRKAVLLSAAVVIVLVGAFVAYQALKPAPPTAASTVQSYFEDLENGDVTGALALIDSSTQPVSSPLLTAKALAAADSRPTGFHLDSTIVVGGRSGTTIAVTFKLGSATVHQKILVIPTSSRETPFALSDPLLYFSVSAASTINGIPYAPSNENTAVVPGVYTGITPANALFASTQSKSSIQQSESGDISLQLQYPTPALAASAQDAVTQQVKQKIDACAQSTDASSYTYDCPYNAPYIGYSNATIKWTINKYPQISVAMDASNPDRVSVSTASGQPGTAHYVATYTDYSNATQTAAGDESVTYTGYASITNGKISLSSY
jgi:hypothetical protein